MDALNQLENLLDELLNKYKALEEEVTRLKEARAKKDPSLEDVRKRIDQLIAKIEDAGIRLS